MYLGPVGFDAFIRQLMKKRIIYVSSMPYCALKYDGNRLAKHNCRI